MNKDEQKKNNGDKDVVLDINETKSKVELNISNFELYFQRQNKTNSEIANEHSFQTLKKEPKNLKEVTNFSISIIDKKEPTKALDIEDSPKQFSIFNNSNFESLPNNENEKQNKDLAYESDNNKCQREVNNKDNQILNSGDIMNNNKTIDFIEQSQKINKDNNESSNNIEEKEKIQYALCPYCSQYANLLLDFDNPKQIFSNCPACKTISTISIDEYFEKVKNKDDINKHDSCTEHNAAMTFYCSSCKKYHCPRCKSCCDLKRQINKEDKIQRIRTELDTVKQKKIETIITSNKINDSLV